MYDIFNPAPRGIDPVPAAAEGVRTTRFGLPGRKNDYAPAVSELVGATYNPRVAAGWNGEKPYLAPREKTAAQKSAELSEKLLEDRRIAAQNEWLEEALRYYA